VQRASWRCFSWRLVLLRGQAAAATWKRRRRCQHAGEVLPWHGGTAASVVARCCHDTADLLPAWWCDAAMARRTCCQCGGVVLPRWDGVASSHRPRRYQLRVRCYKRWSAMLLAGVRMLQSSSVGCANDGQRCAGGGLAGVKIKGVVGRGMWSVMGTSSVQLQRCTTELLGGPDF
jgi:hypothetical protein